MKRSKHEIHLRPVQKSERTWGDLLDGIAHMSEALERIGYRDAPKQLAREAYRRFNGSMKEHK